MKIFDRYVIREFFKLLFIFTLGSIFIFIVVNFFERIDSFVGNRATPSQILSFYLYQIPYIFVLMFPIGHLLAIFFSLGEMARRNELLALKAAGINLRRIFLPLIFIGVLNTIITFSVNEYLSYSGMRKASYIKKVEIEKRHTPYGAVRASNFSFLEDDKLFFFRLIDRRQNIAKGLTVYIFKGKKPKIRIDAETGRYTKDSVWVFYNVTERIIGDLEDTIYFYPEKVYLTFNVSPFEFLKRRHDLEEMSGRELLKLITKKKRSGLDYTEELVEFYTRFSFPFAVLIILFFTLPMAASLKGKGKTYSFGLAVSLTFIYWGILQAFRSLGHAGKVNPAIAAWLPNLIFLTCGIYLHVKFKS